MVPNRLLIHSVLFREHCWAMIAFENPQNNPKSFLQNQQKIGKKPDGQPMVFGENLPKSNVPKQPFNPLQTDEGAISGYTKVNKCIEAPKRFPSKISQKLEKSLMVSPWFLVRICPKEMVPNRLQMHSGLFIEAYQAVVGLENT